MTSLSRPQMGEKGVVMNYNRALAVCGASLATAVAIGVTATPLHARPRAPIDVFAFPSGYVVRTVSYADLNLASAPGERVLKKRVGSAVNSVCLEAVGLSDFDAAQSCELDAWAGARPQIARAVRRAHQIAETGTSLIAAAAITIDLSR